MAVTHDFLRAAKRRIWPLLPDVHVVNALLAYVDHLVLHGRLPLGASHRSYSQYLAHLRAGRELYDSLRQFITDKEYVKLYVKAKVGDEYNVPTFLVTGSADEASAFIRTEKMIAKPTHASGRVKLLMAGEMLPRRLAEEWLSMNFYRVSREGNYRYLRRKIIFETLLTEEDGRVAQDYKFFCFHGEPKFLRVSVDRHGDHRGSVYDCEWNRLNLSLRYPQGPAVARPSRLDEMRWVVEQLSAPFESIRVDLYFCAGKIYVGELTNCHGAGRQTIAPKEADAWIGAFIKEPGVSTDAVLGALKSAR